MANTERGKKTLHSGRETNQELHRESNKYKNACWCLYDQGLLGLNCDFILH